MKEDEIWYNTKDKMCYIVKNNTLIRLNTLCRLDLLLGDIIIFKNLSVGNVHIISKDEKDDWVLLTKIGPNKYQWVKDETS